MEGNDFGSASAPAVRVTDLTKVYDAEDGEVTALDGISLEIERGTVVGILGPNGAGKTTLIKSILDLVRPTDGDVAVLGADVTAAGGELYRHVSAMLEGARNVYWRLSLRENLRYFTSLQGIDPDEVAEENLAFVESLGLTDKLDEPVNSLSRGMKQKATLACTLARRTDLVFLDEPTLGLDVEASAALVDTLREMVDRDEKTVVLSSHDMDVIEDLCDRVVVLNAGRVVVDDSVSALLDAFRTQSHRLRLAAPLDDVDRAAVAEVAESVSWSGTSDAVELTVTLEAPDDYYRLMRTLESAGATIERAETTTPDLESVFLRVTDRADPPTDELAVGGQR